MVCFCHFLIRKRLVLAIYHVFSLFWIRNLSVERSDANTSVLILSFFTRNGLVSAINHVFASFLMRNFSVERSDAKQNDLWCVICDRNPKTAQISRPLKQKLCIWQHFRRFSLFFSSIYWHFSQKCYKTISNALITNQPPPTQTRTCQAHVILVCLLN